MPNLWTHIIFAEQVAEEANFDYKRYQNAYRLGAQGPDPFFYHNFWPWKKDKSVAGIGSRIHKDYCGPFLVEMVKQAKLNKEDQLMKAYVLGFVAHHILDRNAHPYIIYKSGEEGHNHQVLETTIDTILAKKFYDIKTWRTPIYKEIYLGENLPDKIVKLIVYLLETIHKDKTANKGELFNQSYKDMIKALRILYDPTGIKHKLLGNVISPFSHSKNFPEKDYLNEEHHEWSHPAYIDEKSNESFFDIWDRAKNEGVPMIKAILGYFDNKETLDQVKELIGDLSYETGKPSAQEMEIKYFDPIV